MLLTKYFDSEWNLTYNKREAKYYRIAFFNDDQICCDSLSSEYLIDNTKLFEGYYFVEHRDSLHGVCTWFHPNGGLAKKYSYDKGSLHGEQNDYYGDGTPKLQYHLIGGSYDKEYISYFPNGNVEEKKQYRNGMLNGEYRKFSHDGSPLKKRHILMIFFMGNISSIMKLAVMSKKR